MSDAVKLLKHDLVTALPDDIALLSTDTLWEALRAILADGRFDASDEPHVLDVVLEVIDEFIVPRRPIAGRIARRVAPVAVGLLFASIFESA